MSNLARYLSILFFTGVSTAVVSFGADAEELPINPTVTQATIRETICAYGWTKTVRPPYSVTNRIKSELLRRVGLTDADKSRFELDHIIPLSLGGAPSDVRNLRLQPWTEAGEKDQLEACLPRLVCDGRLTLDQARRAIWTNWRKLFKEVSCSGLDVRSDNARTFGARFR